jgi:RNA-directed DNA polymerase
LDGSKLVDISKTQKLLCYKSLHNKKHKFNNFANIIFNRDWLYIAATNVLLNTGSITAGVDGINKNYFLNASNQIDPNILRPYILNLENLLKTRTYQPFPVKKILIPKAKKGEFRPLGIPTIQDRIVQEAIRLFLSPIYEAVFHEYSFGFRPLRNTWQAIWAIRRFFRTGYPYIIEGDLKDYFNTIDHKLLMDKLTLKISDGKILEVIRKQLKGGLLFKDMYYDTTTGTPQGGILSPLLANIFLNEFDHKFNFRNKARRSEFKKNNFYTFVTIRFADDFVTLVQGLKIHAQIIKDEINDYMNTQHLTLNLSKTKITFIQDGFIFLGFHIRSSSLRQHGSQVVLPKRASVLKMHEKVKLNTKKETLFRDPYDQIKYLNSVIRGWCNYFQICSQGHEIFYKVNKFYWNALRKWFKKKYHGKKYKNIAFFKKMQDSKGFWQFPKADNPNHFLKMVVATRIRHSSDPQAWNERTKYVLRHTSGNIDPMKILHIKHRHIASSTPPYLISGFRDKTKSIVLNWNGNLFDKSFFFEISDHPLNWRSIRRNTFKIDKYICQYNLQGCYVNRELQGHRTYIGENTKRLFKTACRNCNNKLKTLYGNTGYRVIFRKDRRSGSGTSPIGVGQ